MHLEAGLNKLTDFFEGMCCKGLLGALLAGLLVRLREGRDYSLLLNDSSVLHFISMCAPGICGLLQAKCFVGALYLNWQPVAGQIKAVGTVELLDCSPIPGDTRTGQPVLLRLNLSWGELQRQGAVDFKS